MAEIPILPVYLFFGTRADEILKARDTVLDARLPKEFRDENLTEYYSTSNTPTIKLAALLDEIGGDLATVSFIADAPKCVVVSNPAEVFGSARTGGRPRKSAKSGTKRDGDNPEKRIAAWIERELPQLEHFLILLAFEDESSGREVNEKSALYKTILNIGHVHGFRERTKAFFRIEDAIASRNLTACIQAVRDLWGGQDKGATTVYNAVVRTLRFLLQANIARERKALDNPAIQRIYFPADKSRNLFSAHPNVRRRYTGLAAYRTGDLLTAYRGVLDVYRAMRPRPGDLFVPDARGLLEQTLARLLTSPIPRR